MMLFRRSLLISVGLIPLLCATPGGSWGAESVSRTVGDVELRDIRVTRQGGSYSIEMTAIAGGKDVRGLLSANSCLFVTPDGQTVSAKYVSMGGSAGNIAKATLLAGYRVPVTVRWSLDNPQLTELLRVKLSFKFNGSRYFEGFDSLKVE